MHPYRTSATTAMMTPPSCECSSLSGDRLDLTIGRNQKRLERMLQALCLLVSVCLSGFCLAVAVVVINWRTSDPVKESGTTVPVTRDPSDPYG